MPRPRSLRLVDEREAVPLRAEDAAARAPVAAVAPGLSETDAAALLGQLEQSKQEAAARVAAAQQETAAAKAEAARATETVEALTGQAKVRIAAIEQERDAAVAAATAASDERRQAAVVASAVAMTAAQKLLAECGRIARWLPALGALLGGWLLFRDALPQATATTLTALAIYGATIVLPATYLTLKGHA